MAKITLTAEEEFGYIRQMDRILDIMPDLEVQVINETRTLTTSGKFLSDYNTTGDEFRAFLKTTPADLISQSELAHK